MEPWSDGSVSDRAATKGSTMDDVRAKASPELVAHVDAQWIRSLVMRAIMCPITGQVLDVRTCHVIRDSDGDPAAVIAPGAWGQIEADRQAALLRDGYRLDTRDGAE